MLPTNSHPFLFSFCFFFFFFFFIFFFFLYIYFLVLCICIFNIFFIKSDMCCHFIGIAVASKEIRQFFLKKFDSKD
jgi:hypothetical protein